MGLWESFKSFFKKKRKLHVTFFDEIGNVYNKEIKYENNMFKIKEFGEKVAYIVDHNFVLYDKSNHMARAYYYVNNPQPIRIQHERNQDLDSIGFRKILDSKVIADLFSEEGKNLMFWILIVGIINGVLTMIVLAKIFDVIK